MWSSFNVYCASHELLNVARWLVVQSCNFRKATFRSAPSFVSQLYRAFRMEHRLLNVEQQILSISSLYRQVSVLNCGCDVSVSILVDTEVWVREEGFVFSRGQRNHKTTALGEVITLWHPSAGSPRAGYSATKTCTPHLPFAQLLCCCLCWLLLRWT